MVVEDKKSFGEKALSTTYKVGGWHLRMKAIGTFILGIILIIIGVVVSIYTGSFGGLGLSVVGLIALGAGWFMWWRSKSFVKGKYY